MLKHFCKTILGCLLLVIAINCSVAKASDFRDSSLIDLNSIAVKGELYIWNRISDLLDIFNFGIAVGPGVGFEVAVTDYAKIGAYATAEQGVLLPHILPPFWLVDYYEKNEMFTVHKGAYATATFGQQRVENHTRTNATETPRYFPRYDKNFYPKNKWDVRAQADIFLVHPYVSFRTMEFVDFIAGFGGYDMSGDDCVEDPTSTRRPADQFGRGICNILFGVFEIPMTINRVNKIEGDLPAISKGLGLGIWRFIVREVVGVVELVTFPFGWEPIVTPEYIFQEGNDVRWKVHRPSFHKRY